jgi:NAD(P)-dependent dehydrogenase (short-subunit alcohol dehydrogenase family)
LPDHLTARTPLLTDRVAVVTGAGGHIGTAISLALAQTGAFVAITDISFTKAQVTERKLRELNLEGTAYALDVQNKTEVDRLFPQIRLERGGIDILVNNAGGAPTTTFADISEAEWDQVIGTNLKGAFLCAQAAFKIMKDQGGGCIINISSGAARSGGMVSPDIYNPYAHYGAGKAGLENLTRSIAFEGAVHGIRANAVAPGPIESELVRATYPTETLNRLRAAIPMGRLGRSEEVAAAVVFLASEAAGYITAKVLDVNGGTLMD